MTVSSIAENYGIIPVISTVCGIALLVAKVILCVAKCFKISYENFGCLKNTFQKIDEESLLKIFLMTIPFIGNLATHYLYQKNRPGIKLTTEYLETVYKVDEASFNTEAFLALTSLEKKHLDAVLLDPKTSDLLAILKDPLKKRRFEAANILYVLAGIKPCYVIESDKKLDPEFEAIVLELCKSYPNFKFKKTSAHCYIVCEKPLDVFDPRKYFNFKSKAPLSDLIIEYFEKRQSTVEGDQGLSYLLGFGPSWEFYMRRDLRPKKISEERGFLKPHYLELATALNVDEMAAKHYSLHFKTLWVPTKDYKKIPFHLRDTHYECTDRLFWAFTWDGVVAKTPYFKKGYAFRSYLIDQTTSSS